MKTIKDYIGKKFIYIELPNTVYTVQECVEDLVKISWDGRYVYYGLSEVMRLFAEGIWEFIETPKLKINIPQDETDHLLSTLANKKRLMEDVAKIEYEYIGECNGNNGNGCFLDSCGQECGCFIRQPKKDKTYTEQEVKDLLEIQRGNCYVALLSHTKNEDIASVALGAPEPGGRNGTWVK